jgi:hypothetical protein
VITCALLKRILRESIVRYIIRLILAFPGVVYNSADDHKHRCVSFYYRVFCVHHSRTKYVVSTNYLRSDVHIFQHLATDTWSYWEILLLRAT